MKIKEIITKIEELAPPPYQESYDNAGLIVGNPQATLNSILLSLDTTEEIIDEAIEMGANLIIAHHPIVFSGLKKITGKNYVERTIIKAIKNDIAIYAAHTNLDNMKNGVNKMLCEKIGLKNCNILAPKSGTLNKIVVYVPNKHAEKVRQAIFEAGAGHIGEYDMVSYSTQGNGTFRASENANPFVGNKNELHVEAEMRVETIFPKYLTPKIEAAIQQAHPYEVPAYDIYSLENKNSEIGSGMVGTLESPMETMEFLKMLKQKLHVGTIKYTNFHKATVNKIALCGGSGSFLLKNAIAANADVFISGDFTYHTFFDAENKIIIADVGHFESEQFTIDLFFDLLTKKFPTFAIRKTSINTNPINYL